MSDTEQKNLAPSQHKLRKAREKGQVASSYDMVSVSVLLAGLVGLAMSWEKFVGIVVDVFRSGIDSTRRDAGAVASRALMGMMYELLNAMMPILILCTLAGIAANIAHKRGIVFSVDPITPDFNRINPGEGLKRLFSLRSAAEFGVSLFRLLAWFVAAGLTVWFALPAIIAGTNCGLPCSWQTGYALFEKLALIALVILIIMALADLPMQFMLFNRDMKMSHTEMKREMKEMEGSPEFQGHRKRTHRDMVSTGGARSASLVVVSSSHAVALFYKVDEAPVPLVVAKGADAQYERILDAARSMNILIHPDPELAHRLYERTMVGAPVPPTTYDAVAIALLRAGLIK